MESEPGVVDLVGLGLSGKGDDPAAFRELVLLAVVVVVEDLVFAELLHQVCPPDEHLQIVVEAHEKLEQVLVVLLQSVKEHLRHATLVQHHRGVVAVLHHLAEKVVCRHRGEGALVPCQLVQAPGDHHVQVYIQHPALEHALEQVHLRPPTRPLVLQGQHLYPRLQALPLLRHAVEPVRQAQVPLNAPEQFVHVVWTVLGAVFHTYNT